MKSFHNQTALITGAGSGIGREFAVQLAQMGCHLVLCDISDNGLQQTKALLPSGLRISIHQVDVSDRAAMFALPEQVLKIHPSVHLLINNAGIASGGEFVDQSPEHIEKIVRINILGVLYGTRAWLPHLLQQPQAHIVNMSSMVGYIGLPGNALYAASKFAIRGFSESLWAELAGSNVGLTVVHAGAIKTNIMRAAEFTKAQDKEQLVALMDRFAMPPERAVKKILAAVRKNKMRQTIGLESYLARFAERFAPGATHWLLKKVFLLRKQ